MDIARMREELKAARTRVAFIAVNEPDAYAKQSVAHMLSHTEVTRRVAETAAVHLKVVMDSLEGERWIPCAERMPEPANECGFFESYWVLARTARGEVFVAKTRRWDDEDAVTDWIAKGPDGYDISDVLEWREIPA